MFELSVSWGGLISSERCFGHGGYKNAGYPLYWLSLLLSRSTFFSFFALAIPFLLIVHSFLSRLCRALYTLLQVTILARPSFQLYTSTPSSPKATRISNMLSSSLLALLLSAGITEAGVRQPLAALRQRAAADSSLTLLANAIQKGSFNDGSDEIGAAEVGQAKSATSQNNFINNCAGKTLTNGLQITTGSCNGISTSSRILATNNTNVTSHGRYSCKDEYGVFHHYISPFGKRNH